MRVSREAKRASAAMRLRQKRGAKIPPNERFLCLVGTHGTQPAWCDVRQSQGHAAIPLDAETIASAPMLSRLFEQMGVEPVGRASSEVAAEIQQAELGFGQMAYIEPVFAVGYPAVI